jgi:histidine ammonia-lyase
MDRFKERTENMHVSSAAVNGTLGDINDSTIPEEQTNELMARLIDTHNLEVGEACPAVLKELVVQKKTSNLLRQLPDVSSQ